MKVLSLLVLLVTVGCGDDLHYSYPEKETEVIKEVEVIKEIEQSFEAFYECDHGGFIDLVKDSENNLIVTRQDLRSINPKNATLGQHPKINVSGSIESDGKITIPGRNYNYSSSTYDIEEDVSGSNITGQHATDIEIKDAGDGIEISFVIYQGKINGNLNSVVAERVVKCTEL